MQCWGGTQGFHSVFNGTSCGYEHCKSYDFSDLSDPSLQFLLRVLNTICEHSILVVAAKKTVCIRVSGPTWLIHRSGNVKEETERLLNERLTIAMLRSTRREVEWSTNFARKPRSAPRNGLVYCSKKG